jgi:hypothetical protein
MSESMHTPAYPALHFFIYIPLRKHAPLRIQSGDDRFSNSAFYLPRWGGLVIGDELTANNATFDPFRSIMPIFLAQIRVLLGFPDPVWSDSLSKAKVPLNTILIDVLM